MFRCHRFFDKKSSFSYCHDGRRSCDRRRSRRGFLSIFSVHMVVSADFVESSLLELYFGFGFCFVFLFVFELRGIAAPVPSCVAVNGFSISSFKRCLTFVSSPR